MLDDAYMQVLEHVDHLAGLIAELEESEEEMLDTVHTCADCEHPVAVILDDGIPFPLCDKCREEMYVWLDECAVASETQAMLEQLKEG